MVKPAAFCPGGNSLNVSRNGTTIGRAANRIGWIGGRGCSRLLPSHASLIALRRPFLLPRGLQGREGRASSGTTGSGVAALLHLAEHIVEVEAGGLLALRILPERL